MDVGGKTLGTKAICAPQISSVYHVFMVEYTQASYSFIKICVFIHKSVSIASFVLALLRRGGEWLKMWLGLAGCCLPVFLLVQDFLCFFARFCFWCFCSLYIYIGEMHFAEKRRGVVMSLVAAFT